MMLVARGAFILLLLVCSTVVAKAQSSDEPHVPDELLHLLLQKYHEMHDDLGNKRYLGLVNYRQPSWEPRFYLIDAIEARVIATYRVAHGRGSDPRHDGYAEFFSDRQGSRMSSLGFFLTGESYMSREPGHGLSLRLEGLSKTNGNAYDRAIVIHANHYMEREFVDTWGMPGRSHGCLVFAAADRDIIVEKLRGGALIYAVR